MFKDLKCYFTAVAIASLLIYPSSLSAAGNRRGEGEERHSSMDSSRGMRENMRGAAPEHMRGEAPEQWRRMAEKLNLTDEQLSLLREHREEEMSLRREIRNEERELLNELKSIISGEDMDDEAVESLIGRYSENHGRRMRMRIDSLINFRNTLTPEQLEELESMQKRGRER